MVAPVGAAPPAEFIVEADLLPCADLVGVRIRVQVRVWVWVEFGLGLGLGLELQGLGLADPLGRHQQEGVLGFARGGHLRCTRKRAYACVFAPDIAVSAGLGLEAGTCAVKAGAATLATRHRRALDGLSLSLSLSLPEPEPQPQPQPQPHSVVMV